MADAPLTKEQLQHLLNHLKIPYHHMNNEETLEALLEDAVKQKETTVEELLKEVGGLTENVGERNKNEAENKKEDAKVLAAEEKKRKQDEAVEATKARLVEQKAEKAKVAKELKKRVVVTVLKNLNHSGTRYTAGDALEMSKGDADPLLKDGIVE